MTSDQETKITAVVQKKIEEYAVHGARGFFRKYPQFKYKILKLIKLETKNAAMCAVKLSKKHEGDVTVNEFPLQILPIPKGSPEMEILEDIKYNISHTMGEIVKNPDFPVYMQWLSIKARRVLAPINW